MMSGDEADLEILLDRDAALTFGNARIAFVMLSAVGSGDTFYGMRQMIVILRNQGDGWRILQIDSNAWCPSCSAIEQLRMTPPTGGHAQ